MKTGNFIKKEILFIVLCLLVSAAAVRAADSTPGTPKIKALYNCGYGVRIDWNKVSNAKGYYIYRKAGTTGPWRYIGTTTDLIYRDRETKTEGVYYSYKVSAYNGTSESESAVEKTYYIPRGQITSLTGGTEKLQVKWTAQSKVDGYQLQYGTSSGFASADTIQIQINNKATVSQSFSSLKNGTYYVRVRSFAARSGKTYYSEYSPVKNVKVTAASAVLTAREKALQIYKKFLSQSSMLIFDGEARIPSSEVSFAICYIDNNTIPELVVDYGGIKRIYTVVNGKNVFAYRYTEVGEQFSYFEKTGIFCIYDDDAGGDFRYWGYYSLTNGKSRKVMGATRILGGNGGYIESYFTIGDTEVSETTFLQKRKALIQGKSAKQLKYVRNTAASRNTYLK